MTGRQLILVGWLCLIVAVVAVHHLYREWARREDERYRQEVLRWFYDWQGEK